MHKSSAEPAEIPVDQRVGMARHGAVFAAPGQPPLNPELVSSHTVALGDWTAEVLRPTYRGLGYAPAVLQTALSAALTHACVESAITVMGDGNVVYVEQHDIIVCRSENRVEAHRVMMAAPDADELEALAFTVFADVYAELTVVGQPHQLTVHVVQLDQEQQLAALPDGVVVTGIDLTTWRPR